MTRLFLDCEFTGLIKSADLISLCLYENEASYFYAEFNDYDSSKLTAWHIDNVVNRLMYTSKPQVEERTGNIIKFKGKTLEVAHAMKQWLNNFKQVEIWGDVLAYDWVLFCELFGGALNLPANILYIPFDLATIAKIKNIDPDFSRYEYVIEKIGSAESRLQHNALNDARAECLCYQKLIE